ncbi:PKD domain-containing protein [Massilia rhizosphaerae]|uniref:PKD domain-containing protein n=1 Tax=Massilia rhizosphaerae TaxID=2784389 RepID=UPI0018DDF854|nr:PKD domain-containing protein [Massilia rhizosphaerae]
MPHHTLQCLTRPLPLLVLPLLLSGLACAQTISTQPGSGAAAMQEATMAPAPTYSVVNLGTGQVIRVPVINKYGQVAYNIGAAAFFYDGTTIIDIPGLDRSLNSTATGLNDKGQVVGTSPVGNTGLVHPFIWSKEAGLFDLLPLDDAPFAEALDVNNYGVAVGDSYRDPTITLPGHAVRWTGPGSKRDLGSLGTGQSLAIAINDAGLIAGNAVLSPDVVHAFAWTPATGLIDIDTLGGGNQSEARAVDELGEIAGNASIANGRSHVFLWTRSGGIRDLGTDGGVTSSVLGMSSRGRIAGSLQKTLGRDHAMTWTHSYGMKDIGTLPGGQIARALAANNYGEVVGESALKDPAVFHAFVWTYASGMIDLNKRIRYLPRGMVLQSALAISDNGSIVVQTNTGLALLKPNRCGCGAAVGPIEAPAVVAAGSPYLVSASLADENTSAVHTVSWSWGDGSSDPTQNAIERNGEGSANASHVYSKPGIYEVSFKVTDKAGHSASVTRHVVVQGLAAPVDTKG